MATGLVIQAVVSHVVMRYRSVQEHAILLPLNMAEIIVLVLDRQKNYGNATLNHATPVRTYYNFVV